MVTDDKVAHAVDLEDNHNSRDQRNVGIWVLVLIVLFMGFLVILGLSHSPDNGRQNEPYTAASDPSHIESRSPEDPKFSVNSPVGEVELPGTVGKEQHFLSGHGNTPVPSPAVAVPSDVPTGAAQNAAGAGKSDSASAPAAAATH